MSLDEISVRDSIVAAMDEVENIADDEIDVPDEGDDLPETEIEVETVEKEEKKGRQRDEAGKFIKSEEQELKPAAPVLDAPQSWSGQVKEKWRDLPAEVQAEIRKREDDIHKMFTSHDGELRMGRELKEVISPYMPIIMAEGGTPAKAVQDLLNTAYLLRTAPPTQKAELVRGLIEQYNIDINQVTSAPQIDPYVRQLEQRLNHFEQTVTQQKLQQASAEDQKILSDVQAFAADPKNVHFQQVKAQMAPLLASGQSKDLQEAYDMACWANPSIRSTLLQAQEAERVAKRKEELAAKKNAASSVTGSPGAARPNAAQARPLREELEANLDALMGSKF